jgi:tetratricopeptide (TPR) repeat protein
VLSPEPVRDGVETHLATLVRKELIRSTAPLFPEDEGFRFRHLLIRDAAYESLPKAIRAELHERFAGWLARHDLVERDEIVGYHLEQAHRYRAELDPADPGLPELATGAAVHLESAGRVALSRGDYNAGRSLLRRGHALYPPGDRRRLALVPDLALALWESGELQESRALLREARAGTDVVTAAVAGIVDDIMDIVTDAVTTYEERAENRERVRPVLESAGDPYALSLYWWAVAGEHWNACRTAEAGAACARSLAYLDASGVSGGRRDDLVSWMGAANVLGPTPVEEGIERIAELKTATGDAGVLQASLDNAFGRLLAMRGEPDEGRSVHQAARQMLLDAGLFTASASTAMSRGWIEERAGELNAAESALREGIADLERLNDRAYRSTMMVLLAENLYTQGRVEEIRGLWAEARDLTPNDDITNLIALDFLEAALLREDGLLDEAERKGLLAIELADRTDHFISRAHARLHLATTLSRAGRSEEASMLATEGFGIIEAKGDITGLAANRRTFSEVAPG